MRRWLAVAAFFVFLTIIGCRRDDGAMATPVAAQGDLTNRPTSAAADTQVATPTVESIEATAMPEDEPAPTETPSPAPTRTPRPSPTATPESELPAAEIVNDEGGPVRITGAVTYTNPFFTLGVAEPVIILEDQSGFVRRDESFLMPVASQTLGQITSDFYTSPFSYSLSLPIEPAGLLNDVDQDGETDLGVQVFAVAYWTNIFGDPFLEERDLFGGGWSTAYASTVTSDEPEKEREIVGGKFIIYSPDDAQGFPSGFGPDGLLFTEDDPIVAVPEGYSVVNLDTEPFTFNRADHQILDLFEPESAALVDYSDLSYPEAFDALVEKLRQEYAFTEYKEIDWDALHAEFRPRFEEAEEENSELAYRRALRDFAWSIPDGHVAGPQINEDFVENTAGGLGLSLSELSDGRVIASFLLPGGPADDAGIELGAEITAINGLPIEEALASAVVYTAPFSSDHVRRLEELRFVTRFPLGEAVEVAYRNPDSETVHEVTLEVIPERESFFASPMTPEISGYELPLEYELLPESGFGYVQIYSFSDNELLTVQLWERMMRELAENAAPGLIIDMRYNGGGKGFLADQMAAYFFDEELTLGDVGHYDEERGEFYFNPDQEQFYLPPEELRYDGEIAVIVGPNCASACEFFAYDLTLNDRATIVGHYPTAGLGGSIDRVLMPDDEFFTYTAGRAVNAEGEIHIEGIGVVPNVAVPVTETSVFSSGDPLLNAATEHLNSVLFGEIIDGGAIAIGDEIEATLETDSRVRYTLPVAEGEPFSLLLEADDFDGQLSLYLDDGTLVGTTSPADPAFRGLVAPLDLVLLVEVSSPDGEGGDYTLRVVGE